MSVSELEKHIGYWLRVVSNQAHAQFSKKLANEKITVAEWVILRKLFKHENCSQMDLVITTGLSRGAISKLIERLKAKKLLMVSSSNNDKRIHRLRLSAEGNLIVPKISALADLNDDDFFKCLSNHERKNIIDLMMKIVEAKKIKTLAIK